MDMTEKEIEKGIIEDSEVTKKSVQQYQYKPNRFAVFCKIFAAFVYATMGAVEITIAQEFTKNTDCSYIDPNRIATWLKIDGSLSICFALTIPVMLFYELPDKLSYELQFFRYLLILLTVRVLCTIYGAANFWYKCNDPSPVNIIVWITLVLNISSYSATAIFETIKYVSKNLKK